MINDLIKVLELERYKRLTKMMKMSVWQKFENYIIIKIDEKKKKDKEESNITKVWVLWLRKLSKWEIKMRNKFHLWYLHIYATSISKYLLLIIWFLILNYYLISNII